MLILSEMSHQYPHIIPAKLNFLHFLTHLQHNSHNPLKQWVHTSWFTSFFMDHCHTVMHANKNTTFFFLLDRTATSTLAFHNKWCMSSECMYVLNTPTAIWCRFNCIKLYSEVILTADRLNCWFIKSVCHCHKHGRDYRIFGAVQLILGTAWTRTELRTVSDHSGATAWSGFSSRCSLRSCSMGQNAAPTCRGRNVWMLTYHAVMSTWEGSTKCTGNSRVSPSFLSSCEWAWPSRCLSGLCLLSSSSSSSCSCSQEAEDTGKWLDKRGSWQLTQHR